VTVKLMPMIYLAEDDAEMRALLTRWLADEGYRVRQAACGTELVSLIAEAWLSELSEPRPALVVTDHRMPEFEGLSVVKAVHFVDDSLPFVLITGFGSAGLRRETARLGPVTVLDKPFPRERLLDAIEDVLS